MKHIPKEEWYLDSYTWCGVTEEGERWYPVSYGDNGTAWRMTKEINNCLDLPKTHLVKKMIKAHLKHDSFFQYHYPHIELVTIKVYPTFIFDLRDIAKKHRIKGVDTNMSTDEAKTVLQSYGYEEISPNEKVIEVGRDNGEFYDAIINETSNSLNRANKLRVEQSVFNGITYLLKTPKDIGLLCQNIKGTERLGWMYDEETNCFPTWTGDVYFPCFAVINNDDVLVYSIEETKELIADANAMLKIIEKLEESTC